MAGDKILLAHGSGGKLSHDLINQIFLPRFLTPILEPLDDSAQITNQQESLALTTDSYVVNPLFFPGHEESSSGSRPLGLTTFITSTSIEFSKLRIEIITNSFSKKDSNSRMSSPKALKRANFWEIGMSTISKRSNKIRSQNPKEEDKKPIYLLNI